MEKASLRALDDSDLLFLLKQGSDAAFTELYDRHWEKVAEYARMIRAGNPELRESILDLIVVGVTGIFGFIAIWLFPNKAY